MGLDCPSPVSVVWTEAAKGTSASSGGDVLVEEHGAQSLLCKVPFLPRPHMGYFLQGTPSHMLSACSSKPCVQTYRQKWNLVMCMLVRANRRLLQSEKAVQSSVPWVGQ